MKIFSLPSPAIILLLGARLCSGANEVSPPSTIEFLIGPTTNSTISFNTSVPAGASFSPTTDAGLARSVNVTFTRPNGTISGGVVVNPLNTGTLFVPCGGGGGGGWSSILADQEGVCVQVLLDSLLVLTDSFVLIRYVIHYNITYGMSSDTSQANSTFCGPPPYSFQSWIVNSTFNVRAPAEGDGGTLTPASFTTGLPSAPTGMVPNSGPRSIEKGILGNVLVYCLVLCVLDAIV